MGDFKGGSFNVVVSSEHVNEYASPELGPTSVAIVASPRNSAHVHESPPTASALETCGWFQMSQPN